MSNTPNPAANRYADVGSRNRARVRVRDIFAGQVAEWSPERSLDSGDSHDKGEQSLCVGEAA